MFPRGAGVRGVLSDGPVEASEKTTKPEVTGADARRSTARENKRAGWAKLDWPDRITIALAVVFLAVVAIPRLPPGVCFGDSGGLQLASATLGITHPPGYAGYATLGYPLCQVPGVDPAYVVSLACLGAGLVAILLCILLQVRLGVMPGLACVVGLALTAHPRVWGNLLAPEVYLPSLAFEAGAAYLLVKYARGGARRDLLLAALLWGIASANRPPLILTLPFFLVAWWFARRPRKTSWPEGIKSIGFVVGLAVLPGIYQLGYLWVRDAPQTPFNYIRQYNAEFHELPNVAEGPGAKLERVLWHGTGRQFRDKLGNTWPGVRSRLSWLRNNLLPNRPVALVLVSLVVLLGALLTFRRCSTSGWLLVGMAVASVAFLCVYRVYGDAADFLPLLFAAGVLGGVALSTLLPAEGGWYYRIVASVILVLVGIATVIDAPRRPHAGQSADARPFLDEVDLETLPDNAVICSGWSSSTPLWYAQYVLGQRRDITIINAMPGNWRRIVQEIADRPIFSTDHPGAWPDYTVTPYRNLWRLTPAGTPNGAP